MSRNSALKSVSSSTAKMWSLRLPPSVSLRRPRNWPGIAVESSSLDAETKKAMPWLLRSAYCPKMAKTKVVEKDRAAPAPVPFASPSPRNGRGDGWKAWPFVWMVPLVSMSRPLGMTTAPSSVRFTPAKPL
ncbi:hypothetical protein ACQJBY_015120 [Aegilops geniculata]